MYLIKSSTASKILPQILQTLPEPSNILLDVDEDFYGVMNGSTLLADVDFELIEEFNQLLATIFTVLNTIGMFIVINMKLVNREWICMLHVQGL